MDTVEEINSLAEDYRILIQEAKKDSERYPQVSKRAIDELLVRNGDWSNEAAENLSRLAISYGSFMLRNALALSIAMQNEDGELGF